MIHAELTLDYQEILDLKKKMDFNLTEHETLVKLVQEASNKGEKAQADMERFRHNAKKIASRLKEGEDWFREEILRTVTVPLKSSVGIDGGFQTVGGVGGIWYAPISVVRVVFENSIDSQPRVDIFWAGIEEIAEGTGDRNPNTIAAEIMLVGETKALMDWGARNRQAIVFIDGPIVDPPFHRRDLDDYVNDRCDAIRKCLSHNLLLGCVKRSRDRFFAEYLDDKLSEPTLKQYPSDQHLIAYLFGNLRSGGLEGPIFSRWMNLSRKPVYSNYHARGVYVWSFFFQKSKSSSILRVDVPVQDDFDELGDPLKERMFQAAKCVSDWTYPGQGYPIPVFLADSKCKIRDGCAEVLYEEILTRGTSVDPMNQIILTQLR